MCGGGGGGGGGGFCLEATWWKLSQRKTFWTWLTANNLHSQLKNEGVHFVTEAKSINADLWEVIMHQPLPPTSYNWSRFLCQNTATGELVHWYRNENMKKLNYSIARGYNVLTHLRWERPKQVWQFRTYFTPKAFSGKHSKEKCWSEAK